MSQEEENVPSSPPVPSRLRSRFLDTSQGDKGYRLVRGREDKTPIRPNRRERTAVFDGEDVNEGIFQEPARPRRPSPVVILRREGLLS